MSGTDFRCGIAVFCAEYFSPVPVRLKGMDAVVIDKHHALAAAAAQQQDIVRRDNTEYLTEQLLEVWQTQVLHNGSTKAKSITITKAGIVWPLLALLTDVRTNNSIFGDYENDPAIYGEIIRAYGQIINHKQDKFEFYSRVLYDFRDYPFEGSVRERIESFVANEWKRYLEDFQNLSIDGSVLEIVIKTTIESIINQRIEISRIKERVRL